MSYGGSVKLWKYQRYTPSGCKEIRNRDLWSLHNFFTNEWKTTENAQKYNLILFNKLLYKTKNLNTV